MTDKDAEEMKAYDEYCMEMFLQWLQVRRQQSLNLKFAKPSNFNEGELAAYNAIIRQLEADLIDRDKYWNKYFGVQNGLSQAMN
jgi:hypothetical protein